MRASRSSGSMLRIFQLRGCTGHRNHEPLDFVDEALI